jgi:hypothetical protein
MGKIVFRARVRLPPPPLITKAPAGRPAGAFFLVFPAELYFKMDCTENKELIIVLFAALGSILICRTGKSRCQAKSRAGESRLYAAEEIIHAF